MFAEPSYNDLLEKLKWIQNRYKYELDSSSR